MILASMAQVGDVMENETGGYCSFRWSKFERDPVASGVPADCWKVTRVSFDFSHVA